MAWQQFLHWWAQHLADWLPIAVQQRLASQRHVLRINLDADKTQVVLQHGGQQQALGELPGLDARQLHAGLQEHPALERIELRLPPGRYLARTVELPIAAADDLAQAIGYQVETLTPFKRDQLWLFCGEQQRLADGKRLQAWMVAVPRSVGQVFQQLELAAPADPDRGPRQVPAKDSSIVLGFRPPQAGRRTLPVGWLLLALNLGALLLAAGLHLDNRQDELSLLQAQGRALQQQAINASDLASEVAQLEQRLNDLKQQRSSYPIRVAVLDELSRRLDSQTWLRRLELRQQQLRLQGNSQNASALIAALDASPMFSDVRFEAALTRDPVAGAERFNLTAEVNPLAAPVDPMLEPQP